MAQRLALRIAACLAVALSLAPWLTPTKGYFGLESGVELPVLRLPIGSAFYDFAAIPMQFFCELSDSFAEAVAFRDEGPVWPRPTWVYATWAFTGLLALAWTFFRDGLAMNGLERGLVTSAVTGLIAPAFIAVSRLVCGANDEVAWLLLLAQASCAVGVAFFLARKSARAAVSAALARDSSTAPPTT